MKEKEQYKNFTKSVGVEIKKRRGKKEFTISPNAKTYGAAQLGSTEEFIGAKKVGAELTMFDKPVVATMDEL
jgi:hypothetical protein